VRTAVGCFIRSVKNKRNEFSDFTHTKRRGARENLADPACTAAAVAKNLGLIYSLSKFSFLEKISTRSRSGGPGGVSPTMKKSQQRG
jgi:hypothetical protein